MKLYILSESIILTNVKSQYHQLLIKYGCIKMGDIYVNHITNLDYIAYILAGNITSKNYFI